MSVHLSLARPPASFASSSLGMPVRRLRLAPSVFFSSLLCLKAAKASTDSTMPVLSTFFMNSSLISHLLPKALGLVVSVSLVCESNAGFSISALTNTHRWLLIWKGFTPADLFFFNMRSISLLQWEAARA